MEDNEKYGEVRAGVNLGGRGGGKRDLLGRSVWRC